MARQPSCPKCKLRLQPLTHGGVALFYCLECRGLWFDGSEVVRVIGDAEAGPLKDNLVGPRSRAIPLACPRGHGGLREVTLELPDYRTDASGCPECCGVWMEATDLTRIRPHLPHPEVASDERIESLKLRVKEAQQAADEARLARQEKALPSMLFLIQAPLAPIKFYSGVRRRPFATYGLIAANIAVFLLQWASPGSWTSDFALVPRNFMQGAAPWTLLTAMFLHGSLFHLAGNMYFLGIFGDNVEDRLGVPQYLALYVLGGLLAWLVQIASAPQADVPIIGASGAISAVMGAYASLFPHRKLYVMVIFFMRRVRALWYLIIWLAFQIYLAIQGVPGVAWWAHIGGLVAGVAFAVVHRGLVRRRIRAGMVSPAPSL